MKEKERRGEKNRKKRTGFHRMELPLKLLKYLISAMLTQQR